MHKMLIPILFALGTAIFWGCYGPTIGNAAAPRVDGRALWTPFKPYVFIGIAYLFIAIAGGLAMMKFNGDNFSYSGVYAPTMKWGFLAGCLGAFGAVCLTTAMMTSKGNALLVMPIVFGGAVTVTAIVTLIRTYGHVTIHPMLWIGLVLNVVGIVIVARNTPVVHGAPPAPAATTTHVETSGPAYDASSPGHENAT